MKAILIWIALLGALGWSTPKGDRGGEGFKELTEQLADADPGKRRRAVRDLAKLGGREAWEHVIGALTDEKGEVADEAQYWLPGLDEDRLISALFGREGLGSKDELLRMRVAEALGRFERPVDGEDLLKQVSRREPLVGEMLLWSVERLARAGKLEGKPERCVRSLEKLVKGKGPAVLRAQAACAMSALSPERAQELLPKWSKDKAPELRRAALLCAMDLGLEGALDMGVKLRQDEVPFVRLAALDAIASGENKRALELLVERMVDEPRYRLKVACVEHLQQLTGRKTKLNATAWKGWVQSQAQDWTAPARSKTPAEIGGTGTVSFAGLPILSDRVCFLIDFSGSLWYETEGRPPRKGKVDELVRAALPRLPAGTQFNIMPYTGEPHPWREQLVEASPRNVNQAVLDFEANRVRGSGNVFDAVLLALQDPSTDRLVILTDGAPTGGAHWRMELMVPLLDQATRFNGVAIDSLVIDARPGLRKLWFELSERTAGRALAVEL